VTASTPFRDTRPEMPDRPLGWYGRLRSFRRNTLAAWPRQAYEQDWFEQAMFGRRLLLLNAPEAIRQVLVENAGNYRRSPAGIRILRPIVGQGLFLSEGEDWRFQRQTIAPALAPRVLPLFVPPIVGATEEAIARLAAEPGPVDLLAALQFLTLEIAGRTMFSLEMQQYGPALRALIRRFGQKLGRPYPLDLLLPARIPNLRDFARRRFRKDWLHLMDAMIAARGKLGPAETPRDLFDLMQAARHPETGRSFSHENLRDQLATVIVAGHETTALALFWSLYLLASAPEVQERLAAEVGGLDLGPGAAGAALPGLAYTRAVASEALRLYPPAYVIVRECIGGDNVPGIEIPPRALVMISPWVLHRHRKYWTDPDAFDPARFLPEAPPIPRLAYLPFGVGPRVCVGAQFALNETVLALALLIQRFRIERADSGAVHPIAVVTTQPDRAAQFRLTLRG
jgi:cytochrome P450